LIGDLYNDLAEEHNISGGEKVRILLDEHEKYADILDLYRLENSNDVDDFNTTQEFINAREVTGGDIGGGILYRSSGPFDDRYGRQDAVAEYIENNNINTVIALADTEKSISEYDGIADNVRQMINNDQVIYSDLGIKIHSDEFRDNVADCCREIPQKEGPYLVQCAWGRDRTGFVCILLEGLMGASYDEVLDDYMLSYKSLYQLTEESNPEKYSLFEEKGDEMVDCISGEETLSDADKKDLSRIAGKYLKDGGLSESEISDLKNVLSGD
jgi:protein tyrosine/serine phosphatase